jgi:hypothetical protein
MKYEKTGKQETSKVATERVIRDFGTFNTLWVLVKLHKFFLISAWAVIVSILYFAPFAPDLVLSMF